MLRELGRLEESVAVLEECVPYVDYSIAQHGEWAIEYAESLHAVHRDRDMLAVLDRMQPLFATYGKDLADAAARADALGFAKPARSRRRRPGRGASGAAPAALPRAAAAIHDIRHGRNRGVQRMGAPSGPLRGLVRHQSNTSRCAPRRPAGNRMPVVKATKKSSSERESFGDWFRIPVFGRLLPLYWTWIVLAVLVVVLHLGLRLQLKAMTYEFLDAFEYAASGEFRNVEYSFGGRLEADDITLTPHESDGTDMGHPRRSHRGRNARLVLAAARSDAELLAEGLGHARQAAEARRQGEPVSGTRERIPAHRRADAALRGRGLGRLRHALPAAEHRLDRRQLRRAVRSRRLQQRLVVDARRSARALRCSASTAPSR